MQNLKDKFLCYKGKPLVRKDNVIYYGSMADECVVMLQIMDSKEIDGQMQANNILVQLMRTGKNVKPQDIVVKKAERVGIYNALEIADIWLSKALSENADI